MRLLWLLGTGSRSGSLVVCGALVFPTVAVAQAAPQTTPWDLPAAQIAHSIAEVLGPRSARLTVESLSQISKDAVPAIRRLVEEDLKTDGVSVTSGESANAVRLTLSENAQGGLWVAEVVEGSETRVVMAPVDLLPLPGAPAAQKVLLRRDVVAKASEMQWKALRIQRGTPELLAAAQVSGELVVLTPDEVVVFQASTGGWVEREHAEFGTAHRASRDARGEVIPSAGGHGFSAYGPGVECTGTLEAASATEQVGAWSVSCHASDDPWPVAQMGQDTWMKAFYNAGRDYFTGVVTPATGTDLPPFYSAGFLRGQPGNAALILDGVDRQVRIAEGGQLKPVSGAGDWGSDFAVVSSGCGGAQVIVSSSGDGAADSLRGYEIAAQEAVAVSEPLTLAGIVMALWPGPDGRSALTIVRTPMQQGQRFDYEVDRVTETCN